METIVRNVRDLNQIERSALEHVVGHQLRESQQLVIQVMSVTVEQPVASGATGTGELPEWCRVYEGLTPEQVDELDSAIVRLPTSRDVA